MCAVQKDIINTDIQVIFCVYLSTAEINCCTLVGPVVASECTAVQDNINIFIILPYLLA